MNDQILRELIENGFPLKTDDTGSTCGHCGDGGPAGLPPTLSELIRECSHSFFSLKKKPNGDKWLAAAYEFDGSCSGETPEDAVALLWLHKNRLTEKRTGINI